MWAKILISAAMLIATSADARALVVDRLRAGPVGRVSWAREQERTSVAASVANCRSGDGSG